MNALSRTLAEEQATFQLQCSDSLNESGLYTMSRGHSAYIPTVCQLFALVWCPKICKKLVTFLVCFGCHSVAEGSSQDTKLCSWEDWFLLLFYHPCPLEGRCWVRCKWRDRSPDSWAFRAHVSSCALVAWERKFRHIVHKEADLDLPPSMFLLYSRCLFLGQSLFLVQIQFMVYPEKIRFLTRLHISNFLFGNC